MFILRLVGILAVVAIIAHILLWMLTRDRRYLSRAWRISQGAIMIALAIMVLLAAERLIVL